MKTALRYAAAVLLLLFALAGCGGGGSEPPGETVSPAVEQEAVLPAEGEPAAEPVRPSSPAAEPAPEPEPEPEPAEEPAEEPEEMAEAAEEIHGLPPETPVYVSKRSSTIHLVSDCCNMKHYREMTLGEADAKGYDCCLHCF